jgi:queuine tRNA-ribosyltransferase
VEIPSPYEYVKSSCGRTYRWLKRCDEELKRLNEEEGTINPGQVLFGINQGGIYKDLRIEHMKAISELGLPGYAIGGLAVGETAEQMYETIAAVEEYMPPDAPRYLMGVGTPSNIIESVALGVDFFDCVMPARNGRHGRLYTWNGVLNIRNEKYSEDSAPIDGNCRCPVCRRYSRAYLRHLFKADEMLAMRHAVIHNLYFYNKLMEHIRFELEFGNFERFRHDNSKKLDRHI